MRRFGPVLFDYVALTIAMRYGDREISIQGLRPEASMSMISAKSLRKMLKKDEFRIGCFCMMTNGIQRLNEEVEQPEIRELLQEYQDVFQEPTELPSLRGAEHSIHLKEGSVPFKM